MENIIRGFDDQKARNLRTVRRRVRKLPPASPVFLKICIISLAFSVSLAGCGEDSAVVWKKDLRFPDGSNVVVAKTIQYSGPGQAAVFTTVDIVRADGEGTPVEILVFEVPNETKPATITVDMAWIDATHLDVAYPQNAKLNF